MKTKEFLLATSGTTVDGRNIDPKMLTDMASAYDPKTYAARVNLEHIRGLSTDGPFKAYGDVLSLSAREVTVNFNGKDEKRTALYGVFDVTDEAKALNDAGQKLYSSIEIYPNFAGQGFAYLAGVALTDSPASVGTERLEFNRQAPGTEQFSAQHMGLDAAQLAFAEAAASPVETAGLFTAMTDFFKNFGAGQQHAGNTGQTTPPAAAAQPATGAPAVPEAAPQFDVAAFGVIMQGVADNMTTAIDALGTKFSSELQAERDRIDALNSKMESTAAPGQQFRAPATGGADMVKTDC